MVVMMVLLVLKTRESNFDMFSELYDPNNIIYYGRLYVVSNPTRASGSCGCGYMITR